jgi:CRISPR-associated protein Csm5
MNITLKTLTPIHIGSGTQYQGNAEYIYFEQEKVLVVVDEAKILDIIGTENIHIWVSYIENPEKQESFLDYLRVRIPNIKPSDIAKRILPLKVTKMPYFTNTLREQIHSGTGKAYIPGSSLKGAIRTVLFAQNIFQRYEKSGVPNDKLGSVHRFNNKFIIGDKQLQKDTFGNDPNSDWLRMLQIGDCYFSTGTSVAFAETLNERREYQYEVKQDVRQLIEYIPTGTSSDFQLMIPDNHIQLIQRKMPELFKSGVQQLNYSTLCKSIHQHALRLLQNEINFFKDANLPREMDGLLDFMKELHADASKFEADTCLLRLGFGSGYLNMTGNWVADLVHDDDMFDDIATAVRRTPRYNGLPLPKSRKVMFDGILPGFVKLQFSQ